jgi:hypothetical protein
MRKGPKQPPLSGEEHGASDRLQLSQRAEAAVWLFPLMLAVAFGVGGYIWTAVDLFIAVSVIATIRVMLVV